MTPAAVARSKYDRAIAAIGGLEQNVQEVVSQIDAVKKTQLLTDEGKKRKLEALKEEVLERYRTGRAEIVTLLEEADRAASIAMAGDPADAALESRKARASTRVARLIDNGFAVIAAAEVFAEAGDLDALRALREEIPSAVAAVDPSDRLGARVRSHDIRELTIAVDSKMAPLLPDSEARAARLRGNIDTAQAWVKAIGEDTVKTLNGRSFGLSQSIFYRDTLAEV